MLNPMTSAILNTQYQSFFHRALDPLENSEEIEKLATDILKELNNKTEGKPVSKRYRFKHKTAFKTKREEALIALFHQTFAKNRVKIIEQAEKLHPSKKSFYPKWKSVCYITLPKIASRCIDSTLFKIAAVIFTYVQAFRLSYGAYQLIKNEMEKSIPIIINYTPIQVLSLRDGLYNGYSTLKGSAYTIIGITVVAKGALTCLPKIPFITHVFQQITFNSLFQIWRFLTPSPQSFMDFFLERTMGMYSFTTATCSHIANMIGRSAEEAEQDCFNRCKSKSLEVWKSIIKNHAPNKN